LSFKAISIEYANESMVTGMHTISNPVHEYIELLFMYSTFWVYNYIIYA